MAVDSICILCKKDHIHCGYKPFLDYNKDEIDCDGFKVGSIKTVRVKELIPKVTKDSNKSKNT